MPALRFARWFCVSVSLATCLCVDASDWKGWRGPDGLGVSSERNLPVKWGREDGVAWRTALAGKGSSSPIVSGERVYLTFQTADNGLHVVAVERRSGTILWDREIARGQLPANKLHNMATPTPVTDGRRIWAMFGTGDIACLDRDGEVLWHRNLVKEYGPYKTNHGYGSSPMLLDDLLYVTCMHQGESYLLALDARSGRNRWQRERMLGAREEAQDSYSSPLILRVGRRQQIVLAGAEAINAYDPGTGDQQWILDGLKVPHAYGRTISGPAAGEGVVVVVASGFQNRGYTVALSAGGSGNVTGTHKLWTQSKFSPDCPTPVVYLGKVFTIRDDGMASCLDLKTGEPDWQERVYSANVKVSPVAADGKVYFMNGQGNCAVVAAGPTFEVLALNELNEPTLSTPAISGGRLFIKTDAHLYCIRR